MIPILLPGAYFPLPNESGAVGLGSVYIGTVDLDPTVLANRVTVTVLEEDGTLVPILAAAQPLTLSAGGLFTYNGSIVQVQVDTNYSMTVLDENGAQVYYFPNSNFQIVDQDVQNSTATYLTNVAGTNTITADTTPALADYVVGQIFHGIAQNTNSGAVTGNISGKGAGAVLLNNAALTGGEMLAGAPFQWVVTNVAPIFELVSQANNTAWRALLANAAGMTAATTGVAGIAELATGAETMTGTDAVRTVTPAGLASTKSLAANGYMMLPGGLVIQWGTVTTNGFGEGTITFPVAFASACWSVVATNQDISIPLVVTVEAPSTTSADVKTEDTAGVVQAGVSAWIAIGN